MAHHRRPLAALLVLPLLGLALAAPASAAAPERFNIDETNSFDTEVCGVDGHFDFSEQGRGVIHDRSSEAPYFWAKTQSVLDITNLTNGLTVSLVTDQVSRDARITDNGDGTITILAANTFNEADYAPDGTVGLRTQGRETALITIDTNGTPDNGDDDVTVDFAYLGFTGHDDRETTDFCDWFLQVTTT